MIHQTPDGVLSFRVILLSFHAVAKETLKFDDALDGALWLHESSSPKGDIARSTRQTHRHHEPEFNFVIQGTAAYLVDGQRYDLRPNSLLWLLPQQDHLLIEESADFAMWIAVFRPSMLKRWVRRGGPRALLAGRIEGNPCHLLAESVAHDLQAMAERTLQNELQPVMLNASLPLLAMTAWQMHQEAHAPQPGQDVHPSVQQAAMAIRQNPVDISLQEVATIAGLSLSRLSRLFKQQTGIAMVTYRQLQRLRLFKDIYGQGHRHNMTHAALAAGFGSYPQFHRVFKQFHSQSPQTYYQQRKQPKAK